MNRLVIYIPTYNRPQMLKKQLDRILEQVPISDLNIKVIVRDNCSSNYSLKEFSQGYIDKPIIFKQNSTNIGGNPNIAIGFLEAETDDFLWILSDNDLIAKNCIKNIKKYIRSDVDIITTEKESKLPINVKINLLNILDLERIFNNHSLISNTIYNLNSIKLFIENAFFYQTSSFPHLAVIIGCIEKKQLNYQILPCFYFHDSTMDVYDNKGGYVLSMTAMPTLIPLLPEKSKVLFANGWIKDNIVLFHLHRHNFKDLSKYTQKLLIYYSKPSLFFYFYISYIFAKIILLGVKTGLFNFISKVSPLMPIKKIALIMDKFKKIEKIYFLER
jgi:glycosyltransferase involved in cell wall biosynthesis